MHIFGFHTISVPKHEEEKITVDCKPKPMYDVCSFISLTLIHTFIYTYMSIKCFENSAPTHKHWLYTLWCKQYWLSTICIITRRKWPKINLQLYFPSLSFHLFYSLAIVAKLCVLYALFSLFITAHSRSKIQKCEQVIGIYRDLNLFGKTTTFNGVLSKMNK